MCLLHAQQSETFFLFRKTPAEKEVTKTAKKTTQKTKNPNTTKAQKGKNPLSTAVSNLL